ncbi:hypothetical protein M2405_004289 [Rhodococcus erythropolis]|nr:hypothetical protein [Rhodococcus erythropolis]MCW2425502.1 hypothetical protein [Rhodococcus erythropolis]
MKHTDRENFSPLKSTSPVTKAKKPLYPARTYDEDLVDLAWRWRHWGRVPADEIFIRFGIAPHIYCQRLLQALTNDCTPSSVRDNLRDTYRTASSFTPQIGGTTRPPSQSSTMSTRRRPGASKSDRKPQSSDLSQQDSYARSDTFAEPS